MPVYMLVKVDFGHRENLGLFSSKVKALAYQTGLELEQFDNGSLAGITFYIEEWYTK